MMCKCRTEMRKKSERIHGERVSILSCPKCGKELILVKDAIRLQEKLLPKIETTRKVAKLGGSIAVTLPKELKIVFRKGDSVRLSFDPSDMELRIRKA